MKRPFARTFVATALALAAGTAAAQTWPSKPIRTILTFAGGADVMARIVAQQLSQTLGQPMVVEVQSGAGGAVGAQMVARAPADGHTILFSTSSTQVMNQFLSKNTGFDPIKDFTPIIKTSETVLLVITNPESGFNSLRDVIAYAKKNPGKLSYGTSGIGTTHHLSGEQIALLQGIDWVHVPFKGGPPVVTSVMTNQIQIGFSILATVSPFMSSGKVKVLAVNNDKRYPVVANIPLVSDEIPNYVPPPVWVAYFGPAGLPQPISRRLYDEIAKVMTSAEVAQKLQGLGLVASVGTPEELTALIRRDLAAMGKVVQAVGIKPE